MKPANRNQKIKINKPPVLFSKTQKIIKRIEKKLGHAFIAYWNSPSGQICQSDVVVFYEILRKIGKQEQIYLFIKSGGGRGRASLRMTHLLREYTSRLTAFVPLACASAATMLALGADEIHMGPLAYLSAIDTSIVHDLSPIDKDNDLVSVSQDELSRIVSLWQSSAEEDSNPYKDLFQYVHPLVIGAVDRASSLSIMLCKEILSYHLKDTKKAKQISEHLNSNYPSHSYPITLKEAKRIGLKVKSLNEELNDDLVELNKIYSEMGQKALTDYDEENYHNNEIYNIIEGSGIQVYYQIDKDWHYRKAERNWEPMNDKSSWRKIERKGKKIERSIFYIR